MYLPQYHSIAENDEWWGEGYTEWTAVKRAQPLFNGHIQPKVPLDMNYYDLSDTSAKSWKWQAQIANKYDVYGFCVYHYWFKGHQLLQKPLEILLQHPEIDIRYTMCWANETWTRTWYGQKKDILMKQEYGVEEDWDAHFQYLLKFFKDDRYIKINNKPVLNIYRSSDIQDLGKMREFWDRLAKKNGFDGIYVIAANTHSDLETRDDIVDAYYDFEPGYTLKHKLNFFQTFFYASKVLLRRVLNNLFNLRLVEHMIDAQLINKMMKRNIRRSNKPLFPGAFTMWDNTPRVSYRGTIYKNANPETFSNRLKEIHNTINNEELDFVFINAWNEWGEGCYLEPDSIHQYDYLEMIKKVIHE
jgi:hypothetical protein